MYSLKDTFNADEFGLSYRMEPNTTIARERLLGRKKEKQRISVLACANGDGSKKFELIIIGSSWKPRSFKKKIGAEIGFDCRANRKAWMTRELLFAWLKRFGSVYWENCRKNGSVAHL